MGPRILLVMPQLPQDPASGAARSTRTAADMARGGGFEVRALGTTASERGAAYDPLEFLHEAGIEPEVREASAQGHREFRFEQRGIAYTLLDTGRAYYTNWEKTHGRQFDRLFDRELETFQPDIVFTYGAFEGDRSRHKRARRAGARIVFRLANLGYLGRGWYNDGDVFLTPSEFLSARYREAIGIESTALPSPLDFADVVAAERDPIFVTTVNPSVEKGLFFFVRLAEELGRRLPAIPVLAIESRGTAGVLVKAGLDAGIDLRRHESIMVAGAVPYPRDIYANTRVLLAPSVWEEPFGRVAAEALVNGVVPLVSDRGGLAEASNGAGFVLPLPADYTVETRKPVAAEVVEPWISLIERLAFDEQFFQAESQKARAAGEVYREENLAPRYVEFFRRAIGAV